MNCLRNLIRRILPSKQPQRGLEIGSPTNFRKEEVAFPGTEESDALMIEKAKRDAEQTYQASRRDRFKQHARKISAKFGTPPFQGDAGTV